MVGNIFLDSFKNFIFSGLLSGVSNFIDCFITLLPRTKHLNHSFDCQSLRQLQVFVDGHNIFYKTLNRNFVGHLLDELKEIVFANEPFFLSVNEDEKEFEKLGHHQTFLDFALAKENTLNKINIDSDFYMI